ncbi:MAG TPA: type II toxin-antitoxin system RelE/ParE family toxin [Candidatus Absconditabacterales bacterium]|nr:type II toxin-antitoxin system RelE/ParE family toxin [Candidatus Absconditabacterales bacterium]
MHSVIFSSRGLSDIDQIREFIAQENSFYAEKVAETIFGFINSHLSYFPLLGKEISLYKHLREIVEPTFKYRIIYTFDGSQVIIYAVFKYKEF